MKITYSTTSRAALIAVTTPDDRLTVGSIPTELEAPGSPFQNQTVALREAAKTFATEASKIVTVFQRIAWKEKLLHQAATVVAPSIQNLIRDGRAEAAAIKAAWTRTMTVPVADVATAMLRQWDLAAFASGSTGEKAAWIERAGVEQLAAIIEAGRERFPEVPSEIWDRIESGYAVLHFIRTAGTAADHARKSTIEEPLAVGVDMKAAEAAANELLQQHHRRSDMIATVEQVVQGVTEVVALTCDMDIHAAFDMLTTGKAPQ